MIEQVEFMDVDKLLLRQTQQKNGTVVGRQVGETVQIRLKNISGLGSGHS